MVLASVEEVRIVSRDSEKNGSESKSAARVEYELSVELVPVKTEMEQKPTEYAG